ncbi:hypothetical protein AAB984_26940, partial [Burkholderia contaminans]|uniref:hypothetical protein n=1 Tax=Burkholderia contaminans TaxID=488447 RepID=UPI003114721C
EIEIDNAEIRRRLWDEYDFSEFVCGQENDALPLHRPFGNRGSQEIPTVSHDESQPLRCVHVDALVSAQIRCA